LKDLLVHENFVDGSLTLHVTPIPGPDGDDFNNLDEENLAKSIQQR
jgi:hypothetical protein